MDLYQGKLKVKALLIIVQKDEKYIWNTQLVADVYFYSTLILNF